MASVKKLTANGKEYYYFAASEEFSLGDAFKGYVCSFHIKTKGSGGGSYSITILGTAAGYDLDMADAHNIPFQKLSDATIDKAAGTAITTDDNYIVRGDGMDVWLDVTITSGTLDVYVTPLLG
jgi:hypothetical protein